MFNDKKFLISNLFFTNNSIIPKIWTLLFSFKNDSNILKYILENLLPFERDIFYVIKNSFYDALNDKTQIKYFIEFTNKTNFFYDEQSFLWKDLIGEILRNDLKEEEYKNLIVKIEKELSNLEIFKDFKWPEEDINKYQEVLNKYLEKINEKIETEKKSIAIKNAENKLSKMRSSVSNLKLQGGLEIFRSDIIKKINNLLKRKEKEDILLKETILIEKEIKDLISISKEKIISLKKNDLDWGNPKFKTKPTDVIKTIRLYKDMLYYATCNELEQKILNSKDNKERMRYGTQIEQLGLRSLLKYINSLGNEALVPENRKTIKGMFRAQLMLKLWNDNIDQQTVYYFIQDLNSKSKRNQITDEEYEFTYQIASEYSLTTKIIQPNFEAEDIIYLFFKYNENNYYVAGPIFDEINVNINMNNLYNEAKNEIKKKNLVNICDICSFLAKIMYREFMKKIKENLPNNYDELMKIFKQEIKEQKSEVIEKIINAMNLSKYYDEIMKNKEKTPEKPVDFDDMIIFNKKDNKRIDIEALLTKEMNPSFKFYIIKNLKLLRSLINSKLSNEDISDLFSPQKNEIYIPFWVFLIRNMSSINCINYENKDNPFYEDISKVVRNKIEDIINEGKGNKLDNSWLNLILDKLDDVRNEIEIVNVRLFYYFFNNLFEKLNANGIIKEIIQNLLKDYYLELLNKSFEGTINNILSEDIKTSNKNILQLIYSPKEFVKNKISNDYSEKSKNLFLNNKYKDLENTLDKLITAIPKYIEEIQENVKNVEEKLKEEKEKEEVNKKFEEIKLKINKYNSKYDNIQNNINHENIASDIQIHPDYIKEFEEAEKDIEKFKELLEEDENDNLVYWKIPFKNDNIHIKIDKVIHIFRGKRNKYLYFKIGEISDEFKERLSVFKSIDRNNNVEKKTEDYIQFEKAEQKKIVKFKELKNINTKLLDLIKNDFMQNNLAPKVSFNGKTLNEIISQIEALKELLLKIKVNLESIKKGNFEKIHVNDLERQLEKDNKEINHYFDIKDNIKDDNTEDFQKILEIKSSFEIDLLSINNNFKIFCDDFEKNLGDIPFDLSNKLKDIFIDNFNMPLLPEKKPHFISYDKLNADSPLLSMPTISKKDGILKCNYKKISFQKGPFCPDIYSKPIILNIVSLVDEEIKAEIEEFPDD